MQCIVGMMISQAILNHSLNFFCMYKYIFLWTLPCYLISKYYLLLGITILISMLKIKFYFWICGFLNSSMNLEGFIYLLSHWSLCDYCVKYSHLKLNSQVRPHHEIHEFRLACQLSGDSLVLFLARKWMRLDPKSHVRSILQPRIRFTGSIQTST